MQLSLVKKLEIEKTKATFIISVLKVVYWVVLVSSISNFFSNKTFQANKWMRKKIPAWSNLTSVLSRKECKLISFFLFFCRHPNLLFQILQYLMNLLLLIIYWPIMRLIMSLHCTVHKIQRGLHPFPKWQWEISQLFWPNLDIIR